jgi:hypothetical protein
MCCSSDLRRGRCPARLGWVAGWYSVTGQLAGQLTGDEQRYATSVLQHRLTEEVAPLEAYVAEQAAVIRAEADSDRDFGVAVEKVRSKRRRRGWWWRRKRTTTRGEEQEEERVG